MAGDIFQVLENGCSVRQLLLVLQTGCNVNTANKFQETPLIYTISQMRTANGDKRADITKLLLRFGADVNKKDSRGQTAFIHACILQQIKALMVLIKQDNIDVNLQGVDGNTGLMYACSIGNKIVVEILLEAHRKKEINLRFDIINFDGLTALDCAKQNGRSEIVEMLSKNNNALFSKHSLALINKSRPNLSINKTKNPKLEYKGTQIKDKAFSLHASEVKSGTPRKTAVVSPMPTYDISSNEDHGLDEAEEFTKMVKAMRECASEIKQLFDEEDEPYIRKPKQKTKKNQPPTNVPAVFVTSAPPNQDLDNDKNVSLGKNVFSTKQNHSASSLTPEMHHSQTPLNGDSNQKPSNTSSDSLRKELRKKGKKHSKFSELSNETMFSKRDSSKILNMRHNTGSSQTRSFTSPAVLQSAFSDPWSSYGDPLPSITPNRSESPLHLPPLQEQSHSVGVQQLNKRLKVIEKDVWRSTETLSTPRKET